MTEETKTETPPAAKQSNGLEEQVGAGLLKDMTLALLQVHKSLAALYSAIVGGPAEETRGLLERIDDLGESVDALDEHVVGQNVLLSRYSFVFDRLVEINTGDADAPALEAGKEPEHGKVYNAGRSPDFRDMVAALTEFDRNLDEEAARMDAEEAAAAAAAAPPAPPGKPAMLSNTPAEGPSMRKALPPMPVVRPRPQ